MQKKKRPKTVGSEVKWVHPFFFLHPNVQTAVLKKKRRFQCAPASHKKKHVNNLNSEFRQGEGRKNAGKQKRSFETLSRHERVPA